MPSAPDIPRKSLIVPAIFSLVKTSLSTPDRLVRENFEMQTEPSLCDSRICIQAFGDAVVFNVWGCSNAHFYSMGSRDVFQSLWEIG